MKDFLSRHPLAVAFVLVTLCVLPSMVMRDFTSDNELRYLAIADEAISDGHVFAFTLDGEPYADKPPLYLWIIMLSRLLLGTHSMPFLAIFSLVPAFVIVSVMDRWLALENGQDRLAVCLMMMTSVMFLGLSVFLRMDMLMSMFIVLSLYTFYRMYEGSGNRHRQELMLPVWIFLALFTKGPVGLMMPVLVIAAFLLLRHRGSTIGKYLGWKTWGIIAVFCAVWLAGAFIDGGKDYLENLLFHQTLGRAVNSFHHKNPFWYYFAAVWYVMAPYSILLVGSVAASLIGRTNGVERSDREIFFCTAVVLTTLMLSCFSGKLAVYFTPVMPFMVLLSVEVLKRTGWRKWMAWSLCSVWIVLLLILAAALAVVTFGRGNEAISMLISKYHFVTDRLVISGLLVIAAGLMITLLEMHKGNASRAIIISASAILMGVFLVSSAMPEINDWTGFGNLCRTIPEEAEVYTLHVRRPSGMKVYLGREVNDLGKDIESFRQVSQGETDPDSAPSRVLVTKENRIASDESLEAFAREHARWSVGPYCVISF